MDELFAWLRVQLDDDVRRANLCADAYLHGDRTGDLHPSLHRHVYNWTPSRVLAEVEAKRRILAEHAPIEPGSSWGVGQCSRCMDGDDVYDDATKAPCLTVRLLALPFAEREGYRAEWRPE